MTEVGVVVIGRSRVLEIGIFRVASWIGKRDVPRILLLLMVVVVVMVVTMVDQML